MNIPIPDLIREYVEWNLESWLGRATSIFMIILLVFIGIGIYINIDSLHLHKGIIIYKNHQALYIEQHCYYDSFTEVVNCYPIVHPEEWNITIKGIDDRGYKDRIRTIQVDEQTYNSFKEGQEFDLGEN